MTKAGPQLADLGLDVRDYLDGSEARQMALRQRIWKVLAVNFAFMCFLPDPSNPGDGFPRRTGVRRVLYCPRIPSGFL